mmetsp:Transcript_19463/g.46025  ORF Transcript_19463/g.46025 Transcript_19463/m.46025 type:complete len:207 (+) Transcript_19463:1131-1751(+)
MAAMDQGRPMPRKTFTELLPVTFTMDASAYRLDIAALLDAKRSGMDVPNATTVMAVMLSSRPVMHPKSSAKSQMAQVKRPIAPMDITKHSHPPQYAVGGISSVKQNFQGRLMMWRIQSVQDALSPSSDTSQTEAMMSSYQEVAPSRSLSMLMTLSTNWLICTEAMFRVSSSFSFKIVSVRTHRSWVPSWLGLKMAPPSTSSRISWN